MKKSLLTLAAALLLSAAPSVAKAPVTISDYSAKKVNVLNDQKAPMKPDLQSKKEGIKRGPTADGYNIDFCGDIASWYYAAEKNNTTYKCYIYINPNVATALAGNQITDITFSVVLSDGKATRDGKVFVSEDINGDPITSTNVTVIDSYEASATYNQTQKLDEPYTIKENTGFFFGYIVEKVKFNKLTGICDYPIGVGEGSVTPFAGYVDVFDSKGSSLGSLDMANDAGANLYLKATTVGDKRAVENIFTVKGGFIDTFTMPVTDVTKDKEATVVIENIGSNDLTTLTYSAMIATGAGVAEEITNTVDINIPGGSTDAVSLKVPDLADGKGLVYLHISTINGAACGSELLLPYIALNNPGYDRKFIVEEGTGTWCGWCPRGIVGFEYMEKNYPDKFIGIAAHYDDSMQVDSYLPLFMYYINSFPLCLINRDPYFIDDPSEENLEYMLKIWDTQLGAAKVDIKDISIEEDAIKVETSTEFAYDDAQNAVCIATAIIEDNIPDVQTNYYAGGAYGECGGWGSYSKAQPWMYKHVARDIDDFLGIEDSLPAEVKQGQAYTSTSEISLQNVKDINNTHIVVMLIDNWSGTALNAVKISAADYDKLSGIKDIISTPDDAPTVYYNLQGMRMQSTDMPAGMYIKRQGASTTKSVIR